MGTETKQDTIWIREWQFSAEPKDWKFADVFLSKEAAEEEKPRKGFNYRIREFRAVPIAVPIVDEPKCPKCQQPLQELRYPSDSPLNRDQWESQIPGDLFCTCHNNHKGNKPYAYFWRSEVSGAAAVSPASTKWMNLPNEQAWWWHWNGEDLAIPHIYSVMYSGTAKRYFIAYPDSRWCEELGGFWLKVQYPNVPSRDEQKSLAAGTREAATTEPAKEK